MNAKLHDSVYDLWELGGLELAKQGVKSLKRELLLELEMSGLDSSQHEIIRYRAVNRWDENDAFDEWARPSIKLSAEAERILGVKNEQLAHCRPTASVMADFNAFISGATLLGDIEFELSFLSAFDDGQRER